MNNKRLTWMALLLAVVTISPMAARAENTNPRVDAYSPDVWRLLNGSSRLTEVIQGIKFVDGEKVTKEAA